MKNNKKINTIFKFKLSLMQVRGAFSHIFIADNLMCTILYIFFLFFLTLNYEYIEIDFFHHNKSEFNTTMMTNTLTVRFTSEFRTLIQR